MEKDFGRVYMKLDKVIQEKGISKTQLSYRAEISHTQINRFCKNEAVRIDFGTIAHLCCVLDCTVDDLLEYSAPTKKSASL